MIDVAIEIPLNGTAPPEMVEVDRPVPLHDTELHLWISGCTERCGSRNRSRVRHWSLQMALVESRILQIISDHIRSSYWVFRSQVISNFGLSPSGPLKGCLFSDLSEACSQLYGGRFLRLKGLFFSILNYFQDLADYLHIIPDFADLQNILHRLFIFQVNLIWLILPNFSPGKRICNTSST